MAAFFSATLRSARKMSRDRSRIASLPVLTRPFTLRAMLAPSTATWSPLSMKFALPVSISSVCSPRKTRRRDRLLLRHPRIERRRGCLYRWFADHYFHGHLAAYSQGLGYARSSALAEPAAERRA